MRCFKLASIGVDDGGVSGRSFVAADSIHIALGRLDQAIAGRCHGSPIDCRSADDLSGGDDGIPAVRFKRGFGRGLEVKPTIVVDVDLHRGLEAVAFGGSPGLVQEIARIAWMRRVIAFHVGNDVGVRGDGVCLDFVIRYGARTFAGYGLEAAIELAERSDLVELAMDVGAGDRSSPTSIAADDCDVGEGLIDRVITVVVGGRDDTEAVIGSGGGGCRALGPVRVCVGGDLCGSAVRYDCRLGFRSRVPDAVSVVVGSYDDIEAVVVRPCLGCGTEGAIEISGGEVNRPSAGDVDLGLVDGAGFVEVVAVLVGVDSGLEASCGNSGSRT